MTDPALVGRAVLAALTKHNDARKALCDKLHDAIRQMDAAHTGVVPLGAKAVLAYLKALGPEAIGRETIPCLRTVNRYLKDIRDARRSVHDS